MTKEEILERIKVIKRQIGENTQLIERKDILQFALKIALNASYRSNQFR